MCLRGNVWTVSRSVFACDPHQTLAAGRKHCVLRCCLHVTTRNTENADAKLMQQTRETAGAENTAPTGVFGVAPARNTVNIDVNDRCEACVKACWREQQTSLSFCRRTIGSAPKPAHRATAICNRHGSGLLATYARTCRTPRHAHSLKWQDVQAACWPHSDEPLLARAASLAHLQNPGFFVDAEGGARSN